MGAVYLRSIIAAARYWIYTCGRGIRIPGREILKESPEIRTFTMSCYLVRGAGSLDSWRSIRVGRRGSVNAVCSACISECDLHNDTGAYGRGSLMSSYTHTTSGGCWGLSCRSVTSDRV